MENNNKCAAMDDGENRKRPKSTKGVRLPDAEVLMTDGPFVDSKEQIDRVVLDDCGATLPRAETSPVDDDKNIYERPRREPS